MVAPAGGLVGAASACVAAESSIGENPMALAVAAAAAAPPTLPMNFPRAGEEMCAAGFTSGRLLPDSGC